MAKDKPTPDKARVDRIHAIAGGKIRPQRPEPDTVPAELADFVDSPKAMQSFEAFWQDVNIERLVTYLAETRDSFNSDSSADDYHVHSALLDHLDSVQGYLSELTRQLRMDPKHATSPELQRLELAQRNMSSARNSMRPEMLKPFVLELPPPKRTAVNYKGDRIRDKPEQTVAVCVPFLRLINGVFTRKFRDEELDYLISQLTGYSYDSVRQVRPDMKLTCPRLLVHLQC